MTHSIDYLRRSAKSLRKSYDAGEASAIDRIQRHPPRPEGHPLKHADFLHVIAQENSFASWPDLKAAVEIHGMDRAAKQRRLVLALFQGQNAVTRRMLADTPDLADGFFGLQCALYDLDAVQAALKADPDITTRQLGPHRPILHLAFSKYIHVAPEKRDDMLAIAELLLAHGADVNDSFPAEPGSEAHLSALYGAVGHADNMVLAEWLLKHGANPNDGESLYHSTELGHRDGLRLLLAHGARAAGTNALPRALDFNNHEAVALLLQAGADPNEGVADHPSREPSIVIPAMHQAARRMCDADIARLLLAHGADGTRPYQGHTAYALARMRGNRPVAEVLQEAGQATELSANETALAAVADGATDTRVEPETLTEEQQRMIGRVLSFGGSLEHIQRLVKAGIDPDCTDEMGMTAIHLAGWEGRSGIVEYLLRLSPDLSHKNAYGGDLIGTILHGSDNCPARAERDHAGCVHLVLNAGSLLHRSDIATTGDEVLEAILTDWAEAHPDRVVG